jgi:colanic acid/amylovoran biosynthesis glycosyltransferase
MLTVAYLANQFPSPVEPYVADEIAELRGRGTRVITGSVRKAPNETDGNSPDIVVQLAGAFVLCHAAWLCLWRCRRIGPLFVRIIFRGSEGPWQRLKALAHTFLGACYAVMLRDCHVDHIHAHHGYFGSWIGMTAARLLGVGFSMTLHGSDLLLHQAYLDAKLEQCTFCLTISEYNRHHILERYPQVEPDKIVVTRLGVDVSPEMHLRPLARKSSAEPFTILSVGRLHAVKDHAFLVHACAQLAMRDIPFECVIAGEGPERRRLERLVRRCELDGRVTLLGHVPRAQMDSLYDRADLAVLTSRSEGIPLVLMEAMARGKIVLAPAITGIPELVIAGQTGFLYEAGSMDDLVDRLLFVHSIMRSRDACDTVHPYVISAARQRDWIRHAARVHVRHNFNRRHNLESFADLFLQRIEPQTESVPDENLVLQQI